MEKLRLNIDGREVTGYKGQTILEVAQENGAEIPTFCFDKRMDTYGSCGICVVEAEGNPKLLRSCATEIADGMVIKTDTQRVRESRKLNLELLLSQHTGDCRAPCVMACPAQTDCQGYVGLIANGENEEALKLIKDKIPLAASIGRVCPHPCEDACRRKLVEEPISILNLKRFAADLDLEKPEPYLPEIAPATGKKIAIIGGGPGGLSAAYFLAQRGHAVTVYDAMPKMGGMLRYGIPEYRLPKAVVDKEAALVEKMGVTFRNNVKIGTDITFESLQKGNDAVIIAIGAWTSQNLRCPGSELTGVYGGIDFLRRIVSNEPVSIGKKVAIVGGGNTAMDACRTAIRLGAGEVYNIYRRTKAEMPAEEIEITEAEEEGVIFKYLVNPLEVIGEGGTVKKMRLQKMRLGEPDASGRRSPEPIEGEEEILEVDTVIAALGQGIDPAGFTGTNLTKWNTVIADENLFTTNIPGVFAIGDCINNGASIAIEAIGHAKKAAAAIDGYLSGIEVSYTVPYRVVREDLTQADFENYKKEPRSRMKHLKPESRRDNFLEMAETFSCEDAKRDAARCLECGCHDFFECKLIDLANKHDVKPDRFKESVPKVTFSDDHPFIVRDPNKCVLCGLCVRMCDEIVGSTALGFVNRGFNTVVKPAFEDELKNTTCISCGQCISVCPTGALMERQPCKKSIPLDTKKTDSICGMCAVGCSTRVESVGDMLVKTTPAENRGINGGIMCGRGRFGMNLLQREGRITEPMIKKDGQLVPVSWYDAFVFTAKKMESFAIRGEKTAVSIGQNYCVEDAGAIAGLAQIIGAQTMSFAGRESGLEAVFGRGCSPNTLEEVLGTNAVFVFGSTMLHNPVILAKLRQAAKKGIAVTVVTKDESEFNLPCTVIKADSTGFIKQIAKGLIDLGCNPKRVTGFDEYKQSLKGVQVSGEAQAVAENYKNAKKAMILYALEEVSSAAAVEIANIAAISGHIGSPRDGIYMLRQAAGSQVLYDLGVTRTADAAQDASALMVFGEDAADKLPEGLSFLMVQDTHMTETAKKADVVFPLMAYPELDGTFVNTERRLQKCKKAVNAPFEYRTSEITQKMAEILEKSVSAGDANKIYPDTRTGECYKNPVLYTDGFATDDKNAVVQINPDGVLFEAAVQTGSLMCAIIAALPVPQTGA